MTGRIRVLHVDDDPDFASLVTIHLERADDAFDVVTAHSASDALDVLDALDSDGDGDSNGDGDGDIDCVVSDYEMPGADGLDLLGMVRERRPSMPFVLFTRRGSEEIASDAIAAGVTDYIQKTVGPEGYSLLANRVKHAVEQHRATRERERSDARLRALVQASSDITGTLGPDGAFTYASPATDPVLGYAPEELVGTNAFDYVHPDDIEDVFAAFERIIADPDRTAVVTYRFRHADGSWVRLEAIARNLLSDPAVEGVVVNNRDVSEHHERERDLAQYETILETIPGGVFVLDADQRFVQLNRANADILGVDRDDLVGEPVDRIVEMGVLDADVIAANEEAVERLLASEDDRPTASYQATVTRPDGEERTVEVTLTTRPGEAFTGVIGVAVDVTERTRHAHAVEQLHAAARELLTADSRDAIAAATAAAAESVLGNPVNGVHLLTPAGDTLALAGTTQATTAVMGVPQTYAVYESDAPAVRAFRSGETVVCGDLLETPHEQGPVRSVLYLPLGENGTLTVGRFDRAGFDDADVRVAELLATTVGATLDRLDRERVLRGRERQLERENDRLESFASLVSHDLRNPLTVAFGQLELARNLEAPEEAFDATEAALVRMNDLVDGILQLARQGHAVGHREPVALATVVGDAWEMVDVPDGSLTMGDLGAVDADPERLQTLFENLFANVARHAGAGTTVLVERTGTGFAVEDDGVGVPAADRARVFETGYTSQRNGTGFGLAIVQGIAEAHGWSVRVTEGVDGGARFEFDGVAPLDLQH